MTLKRQPTDQQLNALHALAQPPVHGDRRDCGRAYGRTLLNRLLDATTDPVVIRGWAVRVLGAADEDYAAGYASVQEDTVRVLNGDETAIRELLTHATPETAAAPGGPEDTQNTTQDARTAVLQLIAEVRQARRQAEFWESAATRNGELYSACENQRDDAREQLAEARRENEQIRARAERDRAQLVRARNDLLHIRGALSPNGHPSRVPMELGERVAPAVEWLLNRLDRIEAIARTGGGTVRTDILAVLDDETDAR